MGAQPARARDAGPASRRLLLAAAGLLALQLALASPAQAAGNVGGLGDRFALVRLVPDGRLDRRFGDRGMVTIDANGGGNGNALALQADGKVVVGGFTGIPGTGSGQDFTLFWLTSSGRLDRKFGMGGAAFTDFGGAPGSNNDILWALAIQGDGKLIAAGSGRGEEGVFALARYAAS